MSAANSARGALLAVVALLAIAPAASAGQSGGHDEPDVFKEKKTCGKLGLPFIGRIGPAKTGSYQLGGVTLRFDQRTRLKAQWSTSGGELGAIIVRGGSLNAVHEVSGKGSGWIEQPYKGKDHGWGHSEVVVCGPKPPHPKPPSHPKPEPAKGKLIVKKVTDPQNAQQAFAFTVTGAQAAPGIPASFSLTGGQSKQLSDLPGGQYTITESAVTGWKLASIRCELDDDKWPSDPWKPGHSGKPKPGDGHSGHKGKHKGKHGKRARQSTGGGYLPQPWPAPGYDLPSGTATVTVPAGKTVVCTFKNEQPPPPPPGKLIVKKITDPADAQASFEFTVSGAQTVAGLPATFNLANGQQKELGGLPGGSYTIAEQAPAGWNLASVTCKIAAGTHDGKARSSGRRGGRPRGGSHGGSWTPPRVVDVEAGSAQVVVPAGKTVFCVFKNVRGPAPGTGRIIVQKLTFPAGSTESFSFTIGGVPEGFELQDGGLRQVHGLAPGSYTITEAPKQGWQLASINCWAIDAPAGAPAYDLAGGKATVQVVAGGTVICAFLNSQGPPPPPAETGTIIVSKIAPGATDEAFGFTTGAIAPAPALSPPTFTLGNAQSRTFGGVPVGIYTVTEDSFSGWTLQQAACSDIGGAAGGPSTSVTGATATINLAAGDIVWCVYTNARAAVPPTVTPPTTTPPTTTPPTGGTGQETETGTTPRSTARLSAPRRCVSGRYSIRVRGGQVSSIAVSLNGRRVKTVRGRTGTATYTVTMPVSKARVQRVSAVVRFRPGVAPSRRTLRATMVRCRAAQGVPKFAG